MQKPSEANLKQVAMRIAESRREQVEVMRNRAATAPKELAAGSLVTESIFKHACYEQM